MHNRAGALVIRAGVALLLTGISNGSAIAMPTDQRQCDLSQLSVTLVPGDPGMGQRVAQLDYEAKPGQSCELSGPARVTLADAPGVTVREANPPSFPVLTVAPGHPAHVSLRWSTVPGQTPPVTPTALVLENDGLRGGSIAMPWRFGPVGTGPSNPFQVDVAQPGPPSR
jgi:uncharacterized protein DUF4232